MYRLIILATCWLSVKGEADTTPNPVVNIPNPIISPNPLNYPIAPIVTPGLASGRTIPGFNGVYYNPASATAPILTYSSDRGVDGTYAFSFTTGDGKQAAESGFLKDAFIDTNTGEPQGTQVVEGSYSYISPEGTPIQVTYVADERGFRPSAIHFPADGKAVLSNPVIANKVGVTPGQIYNPQVNAVYPFNYRNPYGSYPGAYRGPLDIPYNGNFNGTYNPFIRPFDPRYPLDGRYNAFNPYQPIPLPVKEEPKKDSA